MKMCIIAAMIVSDLMNNIRQVAALDGWSPSKLAKEAGLHANALRGMNSGDWNPGAETLLKLEAVARRECPHLFADAA